MEVQYTDESLRTLEVALASDGGFPPEAVRGFRKVMQVVRAAVDERDLYAMKSLHFEKLKGNRAHQHSLRLNKQWRLIVEIISAKPKNIIAVVSIEDYH